MKWLQIWRFVCGYGMISVEGCVMQHLLEYYRTQQISLWDARPMRHGFCFFTNRCGIRAMEKWCRLHPKTRMQLQKKGFLALRDKMRRHPLFVLLPILFAAMLFAAQCFYWTVDVTDVPRSVRPQVQEVLRKCGLQLPMAKAALDRSAVGDRLLLSIPELSFVQLQGKGVSLYISAVLRDPIPQIFDADAYSRDVIAPCDASILSIAVTSGTACVAPGDCVRAGDVLISGFAGREGFERGVRAQGRVEAMVSCNQTCTYQTGELLCRTGQTDTARLLYLGKICLSLEEFDTPMAAYEQRMQRVDLLSQVCRTPFYLQTVTRYALDAPKKEELCWRAGQFALAETMRQIHEAAQIIDTDYEYITQGDRITVNCTLTAKLIIASTQEVYEK